MSSTASSSPQGCSRMISLLLVLVLSCLANLMSVNGWWPTRILGCIHLVWLLQRLFKVAPVIPSSTHHDVLWLPLMAAIFQNVYAVSMIKSWRTTACQEDETCDTTVVLACSVSACCWIVVAMTGFYLTGLWKEEVVHRDVSLAGSYLRISTTTISRFLGDAAQRDEAVLQVPHDDGDATTAYQMSVVGPTNALAPHHDMRLRAPEVLRANLSYPAIRFGGSQHIEILDSSSNNNDSVNDSFNGRGSKAFQLSESKSETFLPQGETSFMDDSKHLKDETKVIEGQRSSFFDDTTDRHEERRGNLTFFGMLPTAFDGEQSHSTKDHAVFQGGISTMSAADTALLPPVKNVEEKPKMTNQIVPTKADPGCTFLPGDGFLFDSDKASPPVKKFFTKAPSVTPLQNEVTSDLTGGFGSEKLCSPVVTARTSFPREHAENEAATGPIVLFGNFFHDVPLHDKVSTGFCPLEFKTPRDIPLESEVAIGATGGNEASAALRRSVSNNIIGDPTSQFYIGFHKSSPPVSKADAVLRCKEAIATDRNAGLTAVSDKLSPPVDMETGNKEVAADATNGGFHSGSDPVSKIAANLTRDAHSDNEAAKGTTFGFDSGSEKPLLPVSKASATLPREGDIERTDGGLVFGFDPVSNEVASLSQGSQKDNKVANVLTSDLDEPFPSVSKVNAALSRASPLYNEVANDLIEDGFYSGFDWMDKVAVTHDAQKDIELNAEGSRFAASKGVLPDSNAVAAFPRGASLDNEVATDLTFGTGVGFDKRSSGVGDAKASFSLNNDAAVDSISGFSFDADKPSLGVNQVKMAASSSDEPHVIPLHDDYSSVILDLAIEELEERQKLENMTTFERLSLQELAVQQQALILETLTGEKRVSLEGSAKSETHPIVKRTRFADNEGAVLDYGSLFGKTTGLFPELFDLESDADTHHGSSKMKTATDEQPENPSSVLPSPFRLSEQSQFRMSAGESDEVLGEKFPIDLTDDNFEGKPVAISKKRRLNFNFGKHPAKKQHVVEQSPQKAEARIFTKGTTHRTCSRCGEPRHPYRRCNKF